MKNKLLNSAKFAGISVAIIWIVFLIDWLLNFQISHSYGLRPRDTAQLIGILITPLLHGSLAHIWSNSFPLFIFLLLMSFFYREVFFQSLGLIYVLTGALVWIFGRDAYHVGASGVIYGLLAFLVVAGFMRKNVKLIALSIIVAVIYGGLIYGVLPGQKGISWESHLFGAISGAIVAYLFRNKKMKTETKSSNSTDFNL